MGNYKKIFLIGYSVLIVAIAINVVANALGILTWYDFLDKIGQRGFKEAFLGLPVTSALFLFAIYPFLLGYTAFISYTRF